MNVLSVESLSKSYGMKFLFKDVTFGISQGKKVALVARNGVGKTSLLRMLAGLDTPDSGRIVFRKDLRVAFLSQEPVFDENATVMDALFTIKTPVFEAVRAYTLALEQVNKEATEAAIDKLNSATEKMNDFDAWDYESKIKQVLSKLNITWFEQQVKSLSGGQRKRLALAQVLVTEPDMMVLDEPTNHLDIDMIEWLEGYLISKNVTLLLVTHDRYFLDRICDEIIELDPTGAFVYKGNYSYYVERKAEREAITASEIDKAKNLYWRELEWVRKMPKARGTKAKSRVDAFDGIKDKAFSEKREDKVELSIKMNRLGGKIIEFIKVKKSFGDLKVLTDFSYVFKHREKIGVVGPNGVGKSTFLNMLQGIEPVDAGKIQAGETIVFGYYSQAGLKLNEDKRVIEVVKDIAEFIPMADGKHLSASQLLQRFNFGSDIQYTPVSKLSGGERRRLYLCTILMKNPNFLILDEPTNDLDIQTLTILEDFLRDYPGCVLIVTHDRFFMDRLVDHIFVFEGAGEVKDFPGNYSQYREWKDEQEESQKQMASSAGKQASSPTKANILVNEPPAEKKKLSFKEKFEFDQLEKELPLLEKKKEELTEKLNSGITDHAEILSISKELEQLLANIDAKTERWLELSELAN